MNPFQFRRHHSELFGLILITLVLLLKPSAPALSAYLEETNLLETRIEPPLVEFYNEEWRGVTRQIEPYFNQQAYLKASNVGEEDYFGGSVAISGDTLVIGASGEDGDDSGDEDNTGAVYVFVRNNGAWTQQAYLKASNAESGDNFGGSVAIWGDTLVVGATEEDGNGTDGEENNSASAAGAVYVFVRRNGVWTQQAYLKASNAESGDRFGDSVAIDGETVVVGALFEDSNGVDGEGDNSSPGAGAAYVFVRDETDWIQQAYLKATFPDEDDYFGGSVSISGNQILIGAYGEDSSSTNPKDNTAEDAGAAYFFWRNIKVVPNIWSEKAYLKASNAEAGDFFGVSVAILGDTLVVGASGEDSNGLGEGNNDVAWSGAAYVFEKIVGEWEQQAYLKADNPGMEDFFGESIAISQDMVIISAWGEVSEESSPENRVPFGEGATYVFLRNGGAWTQDAYLKAANAELDDYFGLPVAISGRTMVMGAYGEDSDGSGPEDNNAPEAGAAYVFSTIYPLSGYVYEGEVSDETHPIEGVDMTLYCSDDESSLGVEVDSMMTDSAGWYVLETYDYCEIFTIVEKDPEHLNSVGAVSEGGVVIDSNTIQYSSPLLLKTLDGNKFWDSAVRSIYLPLILR